MTRVLAVALAVCLCGTTSLAQTHPNLAGTWKLGKAGGQPNSGEVEGRGNSPDGGLGVGIASYSLVISQEANAVTVQEHYSAPLRTVNPVVYALDGQPTKNQFRMARVFAPADSTTKWQDNKLVSSVVVSVPGEALPHRYEQTMSIDSDGNLVVRLQGVGTPSVRTLFYRR